jgi:hypothetical protein
MSGTLVQVVASYVLADDTPAQGTVLLTPVTVAGMSADTKRLVTRHSVAARLDSGGAIDVSVLASDDPDWMVDGPVLYEVAEYIAGARGKGYLVHIPGPGPVDLADLQPVDDPQTVAPFPVKGDKGDRGDPGVGIRILSAVPTVADLPETGEDGDAHLVIETGDLWVWGTDGAWHDSGHVQGPPGPPVQRLDDIGDVDVSLSATGMSLIKQVDGTWKGQNIRVSLNQLTDVTAPATTPPNSLLGTVGEGAAPGQAEWEPLHLDYVQQVVLGPIPSSVADLSQRVTELEHTGEVVPPDLELTVDLYSGSFTRIIGCDPVTASPSKRIRVTLATAPGPNGAVFATLADISGTGAVWADFGGTLGKVVDTSGTSINGAALKEAIRRGQIVTVHRGTDGTHPTLVVEQVENPADAGSSLTLDALKDVTAPANTPAGKMLGTTAAGEWGPVASPIRSSRPNSTDRLIEVWDGAAWLVSHYDSGWRDISGGLINGWASAVHVLVRRVGQTVFFSINGTAASGWTAPEAGPVPQGFQPLQGIKIEVPIARNTRMERIHIAADGTLVLASADGYDGNAAQMISWSADQGIPQSLPGLTVSTAD